MSQDSGRVAERVSRRKFILTTGAAGAAGLAGCSGDGGGDGGNGTTNGSPQTTDVGGQQTTPSTTPSKDYSPLKAGGSSTVYPIMRDASGYWGSDFPASDAEYWIGTGDKRNDMTLARDGSQITTDKSLAEYWAAFYEYTTEETSGSSGTPPFLFTANVSHSGTGCENLYQGILDIGDSSAPVSAEKPDWPQSRRDKFTDHVVGVDGQPIVVSQEIKDAGLTEITGDELKGLYKGEYSNWSELGGPDKPIQVLGRAVDSGTRTSFVSNVYGNPNEQTQVANRFGKNQQLARAIGDADNAISYLALAFVGEPGVAAIDLVWNGTTYSYGENLGAKEYPLSRDLHAYTWDGTSEKEAVILNMVLEDFGQSTFVEPHNYFKLPDDRQQAQLEKLPDPATIPE
ncbi:MAG: PstS family phosphate ABC transporter substrate-binding protein [Halobacteriaceae archaeon]